MIGCGGTDCVDEPLARKLVVTAEIVVKILNREIGVAHVMILDDIVKLDYHLGVGAGIEGLSLESLLQPLLTTVIVSIIARI